MTKPKQEIMRTPILLTSVLAGALLVSCTKDKNSPGYEFMPDMYYSPAYKPGEANPNFADGKTNQNPVAGTIAYSEDSTKRMNFMPYPYDDSPEGRAAAYANLRNPLPKTMENLAEGERLYTIFCAPCHGTQGKGDGSVVKVLLAKDNYGLQPPAYDSEQLRDITEGQIYHAMQWGKNNMGSYASQLSAEERWKVAMYVQTLQKPAVADSAAAPAPAATPELANP
jgi:mono/diheme cytochrome c family protein